MNTYADSPGIGLFALRSRVRETGNQQSQGERMIRISSVIASAFVTVAFAMSAAGQDDSPKQPPKDPPKQSTIETFAQKVKISGEVRTRFEWRDPLGYGNAVQLNNDQDL